LAKALYRGRLCAVIGAALILEIGFRKKFGKNGISKLMIWIRIFSGMDRKEILKTC